LRLRADENRERETEGIFWVNVVMNGIDVAFLGLEIFLITGHTVSKWLEVSLRIDVKAARKLVSKMRSLSCLLLEVYLCKALKSVIRSSRETCDYRLRVLCHNGSSNSMEEHSNWHRFCQSSIQELDMPYQLQLYGVEVQISSSGLLLIIRATMDYQSDS